METKGSKHNRISQIQDDLPLGEKSTAHPVKTDEFSQEHLSELRLLIIVIMSIFFAEVIAMVLIYELPPLPYEYITFIDAGVMTVLIFPVLYLLSFRPLIRHIEKRQQAERSLRQKEELEEKFFDSIDVLIAYMDRDFNFIRVNNAYAQANGQTADYFIGKNHFALYPHPENQRLFQQVAESGEPLSMYETPFEYLEDPERGVMYWDWSIQPVKGPNGTVEGLVLSLLDVTKRKQAEAELRKAHDELELRVQERTEELGIANSELEDEIIVRKQAEAALRAANEELTRFNKIMIGRELRMIELKKEVNKLCKSASQRPRYALGFEEESISSG